MWVCRCIIGIMCMHTLLPLYTLVQLIFNKNRQSANHIAAFNSFKHVDMLKITRWSSNQASEWGRKETAVVLDSAWLLCQTVTADLLGFSHATISKVYRKRKVWKERMSSEWQVSEWKSFVSGENGWMDGWTQTEERQQELKLTLVAARVCRVPCLNVQHVEPWSK